MTVHLGPDAIRVEIHNVLNEVTTDFNSDLRELARYSRVDINTFQGRMSITWRQGEERRGTRPAREKRSTSLRLGRTPDIAVFRAVPTRHAHELTASANAVSSRLMSGPAGP